MHSCHQVYYELMFVMSCMTSFEVKNNSKYRDLILVMCWRLYLTYCSFDEIGIHFHILLKLLELQRITLLNITFNCALIFSSSTYYDTKNSQKHNC